MKRYLKLLRIFLGNSLQLELEYRMNLLMDAVNALLVFGAGLVVLAAMFNQAESVGGWSFPEALALLGVFMIVEALVEILLYPNLSKLPEYIRTGSLDFMLLKPVSSQFLVSFRYLNVWRAPELVLGLGLIVYGMAALDSANPGSIALLLAMLASGATITYAIWCLLITTAFWLVRVPNIPELFNAFLSAGRFPVSAFPAWARLLLTFVVPVAFITTVPAAAAVGRLDWTMAVASFAIAAATLALSAAFWRFAVGHYTSASS